MTAETVDVATAGSTLGTTTSLICIGRGVVQPLDFLVNKSFTFNCKRQTPQPPQIITFSYHGLHAICTGTTRCSCDYL